MKTINDLFSNTRNKILSGKRLTKDDMAYQLSAIGGWNTPPFCALLDYKRSELVVMFNSKFQTDIV